MINPTELRIGNLIQDEAGKIHKVNTLNNYSAQGINEDYFWGEYFGVPIDEGWLVKLGFVLKSVYGGYADKNHSIELKDGIFTFFPFCTNDVDCRTTINYVHQLQNITHALTGQELTIKY